MKKLVFLLALSLCSLAAWAYDFSAVAPTGQTLYYTITSPSTVSVIPSPWSGYTQPAGRITIPSSVTDGGTTYSVTAIGYYAFSFCSGLTSVTIPNSVTAIADYAFYCCSGLTSVTIPNSVTSIGHDAFNNCSSLTSVTIPNSVTAIGDRAFSYCSGLTSVTIPNSVTSIGTYTFYYCSSLTSVTIPNSVTTIGGEAFCNCIGLTSVTIPNSVTAIGTSAFAGCSGLTSVTIPNSVTSIGDGAFSSCRGLTSVTIPNSVTSIGVAAFSNCFGLTSVTIPNSVTSISVAAFNYCISLTSVTIPNSVTSIGDGAFSDCSGLTSVTIPNSVTSIGDGAFAGCSGLTSVTIPNSVTSIGVGAFSYCSGLTSLVVETGNTVYDSRNNCNAIIKTATNTLITGTENTIIPNSVTAIGDYAFSGRRGLTSVTIPNSVTSIGNYAFSSCSILTSVTIPNSVTSIGDYAFDDCVRLTSVTIPNSVTSIGCDAFSFCSYLTSVTIPNSVTSIGDSAFYNCGRLKTVYNLSNLTFTKGVTDYGYVAYYANRVLSAANNDFTNHGSGKNAMHKLSNDYMVVDVEDGIENHIPKSSIPANFIYKGHGNAKDDMWRATEIILTDGEDGFEAPVDFVADRATYTREFVNGNRSTLYLPFSAAVPEGFEVYDFANFDNSTLTFSNHTGDIAAYTPYLVGYDLSKDGEGTLCTISQTNAFFPASTPANYHPVTRNNMTFSGVIERTQMYSSNNYGYTNGSFVHSNGTAHVNPFRSFFTFDAPVGAPAPAPVLNIEFGDPVSIYDVEPAAQQYDGRYGNDVFDMMGRIVRKNADNLNGLPRGIYIWKGKKVFANN